MTFKHIEKIVFYLIIYILCDVDVDDVKRLEYL